MFDSAQVRVPHSTSIATKLETCLRALENSTFAFLLKRGLANPSIQQGELGIEERDSRRSAGLSELQSTKLFTC